MNLQLFFSWKIQILMVGICLSMGVIILDGFHLC